MNSVASSISASIMTGRFFATSNRLEITQKIVLLRLKLSKSRDRSFFHPAVNRYLISIISPGGIT